MELGEISELCPDVDEISPFSLEKEKILREKDNEESLADKHKFKVRNQIDSLRKRYK